MSDVLYSIIVGAKTHGVEVPLDTEVRHSLKCILILFFSLSCSCVAIDGKRKRSNIDFRLCEEIIEFYA